MKFLSNFMASRDLDFGKMRRASRLNLKLRDWLTPCYNTWATQFLGKRLDMNAESHSKFINIMLDTRNWILYYS